MSDPLPRSGIRSAPPPGAAPVCEPRLVAIELDGILRQVPALYHRSGRLGGRLVTVPYFRASCEIGGPCPVPVPMALYRPRAHTDRRLIVVDDHQTLWVLAFAACHAGRRHAITGFC